MKTLTGSLLVALLLTGCSSWHELRARHDGRREAARDIAAGNLRMRTYGLPIPGGVPTYETLLAERLGVKVYLVAGCLVTPELVAKTEAYNAAVEAEIARRFGDGMLKSLEKEAARIDSERAALH